MVYYIVMHKGRTSGGLARACTAARAATQGPAFIVSCYDLALQFTQLFDGFVRIANYQGALLL